MAEKKVRWGLISTARINQRIIPAIRASKDSVLLAVASRDFTNALQYAKEWDIPRAYGSYKDLLEDPDVDVVHVSLPNSCHAEWSIKAAEARKHVLCEKPMALSPRDVDQMAEAARSNRVLLQEAFMYRFHPQIEKVQELIAQGSIGELKLIRGIFAVAIPKNRRTPLDPTLGVGSLWDLGCYPVHLARTLFRETPLEVTGWQITDPSGIDRVFAGQARFANGGLCQISASYQEPTPELQKVPLGIWRAELIGTEGVVVMDHPWQHIVGLPTHLFLFRERSDMPTETFTFKENNAYLFEIDSMSASILQRKNPLIQLADSRGNAATLAAFYESARKNQPINTQELIDM